MNMYKFKLRFVNQEKQKEKTERKDKRKRQETNTFFNFFFIVNHSQYIYIILDEWIRKRKKQNIKGKELINIRNKKKKNRTEKIKI